MRKYMMPIIVGLLIASVVALTFGCNQTAEKTGGDTAKSEKTEKSTNSANKADEAEESVKAEYPQVIMETTQGRIVIELFDDDAPNTVKNFQKLIKQKFYDGLTFHRYEPGFVIQGGDPKGDGTGGPGYTIKAEFNDRPHETGTVAMARSADPDSAGSQFYIVLSGTQAGHLDGQYTVFGQVIEGMDNVMRLRIGDKMEKVTLAEDAGE